MRTAISKPELKKGNVVITVEENGESIIDSETERLELMNKENS